MLSIIPPHTPYSLQRKYQHHGRHLRRSAAMLLAVTAGGVYSGSPNQKTPPQSRNAFNRLGCSIGAAFLFLVFTVTCMRVTRILDFMLLSILDVGVRFFQVCCHYQSKWQRDGSFFCTFRDCKALENPECRWVQAGAHTKPKQNSAKFSFPPFRQDLFNGISSAVGNPNPNRSTLLRAQPTAEAALPRDSYQLSGCILPFHGHDLSDARNCLGSG